MKLLYLLLLTLPYIPTFWSKVFTRCRLAEELARDEIIHKTFLGNFMQRARIFLIYFIAFNVLINSLVISKRFDTRCKLVRELLKVGIHNDLFLGQWVCLIEKVSNRNTAAFNVTPSGKKHYGLYQIPSRWCREGKKGGECKIACESLLDDDIRDDTACAVMIFHREGFKYWSQWTTRCKNDNHITNEIYRTCPDLTTPRSSPDRNLAPRNRRLSRSLEDLHQNQTHTFYTAMHVFI